MQRLSKSACPRLMCAVEDWDSLAILGIGVGLAVVVQALAKTTSIATIDAELQSDTQSRGVGQSDIRRSSQKR